MKYLRDICRERCFKPNGILHVGASMLEEAEQYRDELGVKTVIWVEAQPHSERRSERAKWFDQVLYEQTPFSDKTEVVELRFASNEVSSSILPFKRHSEIYPDIVVTKTIPVVAVRADEFLVGRWPIEIDTLVLDVQGAELKVLKGLGELLTQIKLAWIETNLNELYEGCPLQPELDDWMAKHGFPNRDFQEIHKDEWGECAWWR
jgi:FkbM family methyltransferase